MIQAVSSVKMNSVKSNPTNYSGASKSVKEAKTDYQASQVSFSGNKLKVGDVFKKIGTFLNKAVDYFEKFLDFIGG